MKTRTQSQTKRSNRTTSSRGRTEVEGQNPKANDATDQDLYHDDNRSNPAPARPKARRQKS